VVPPRRQCVERRLRDIVFGHDREVQVVSQGIRAPAVRTDHNGMMDRAHVVLDRFQEKRQINVDACFFDDRLAMNRGIDHIDGCGSEFANIFRDLYGDNFFLFKQFGVVYFENVRIDLVGKTHHGRVADKKQLLFRQLFAAFLPGYLDAVLLKDDPGIPRRHNQRNSGMEHQHVILVDESFLNADLRGPAQRRTGQLFQRMLRPEGLPVVILIIRSDKDLEAPHVIGRDPCFQPGERHCFNRRQNISCHRDIRAVIGQQGAQALMMTVYKVIRLSDEIPQHDRRLIVKHLFPVRGIPLDGFP